jgi:hypothetical protein
VARLGLKLVNPDAEFSYPSMTPAGIYYMKRLAIIIKNSDPMHGTDWQKMGLIEEETL